ncbi:putative polyol transporter [Heracleum sosnowskyi]|uniref:Polyol transporter n=1 Tax=Heracleum sosnowskyi TaxID=360622 RepID=A0AAD8H9U8_9APIA|nr:putative polyol transporter [Heracleum sosnowskyi]
MKNEDVLPLSEPTSFHSSTTTSSNAVKKESSSISSGLFDRGRYKFWALAAILLLAFWSMFTGTVTLRWSTATGNLNRFSDDFQTPLHRDLDVLEMEEREKMVNHMWDLYTNNRRIEIPRFWQDAFEAGYEDLISDVVQVREAAISQIAKMSMHSIQLDPPPLTAQESTLKQEVKEARKSAVNAL